MWIPTEDEKFGVVIGSFRSSASHSLALELGETVQILEKCDGKTYKREIKEPVIHLYNFEHCETVVPLEDPIITECTSTLQEWGILWKQLYVKHRVELFQKLRHVMNELMDLRRQLILGHMTQEQSREVKRHITLRLDWGNEHLGLDLVPRKEFEMVDPDQFSVSDVYKMGQRHGDGNRIPIAHHLFLNLKNFTYNSINEDVEVFFSLYDARETKFISERFLVKLNKSGGPQNPEKVDRLCTLFMDLSTKDLKKELYIVAHVIRTGRMLLNDSKKGPPHVQYRRPYGCAALAMSDVFSSITDPKEEKDFVLKIYTCNNESEWYQVHENIIRKSSTKYSAPSTNYGLIVSLQLFRGDLDALRRENQTLFNGAVSLTRKLGFPDIILPGDTRNDIYLTLERGDFERGGKSVQKNIEVSVYVLYADGETLKDCISVGCGEPNVSDHCSFVLYHNNSPRWSESLKLSIPIERFRGSHLRFEFRHCSMDLLTLLKWKANSERVLDVLGRLRVINGEEIVKKSSKMFAFMCRELIRCLKWYMDRSAEVVRQDHIQDAMRALEYLFKFIVQSRSLYSRATCGMEEEQFRASIHELFQSIRFLLSLDGRNAETLVCTQATLLTSFPDIFDELLQMFTVQEVAELVRGTLASMPSTVDIGQSMDVVKLQSISRTVDSRLFYFPESRSILLPVVLHHIHLHLRQQRELLLCAKILSSIFSILNTSAQESLCVQDEVEMMVESLLDVLLQTLLSIMSKSQAVENSRNQRCPQCTAEITEFLLKIFCVFRNLMKLGVFPRDWSAMRLLTSQYGDLRVQMVYELYSMWQKLGDNKPHFTPGMMGPFLGVTLVPQAEIRKVMVPIFHDMMDWEQRKNGNFKQFVGEDRAGDMARDRGVFCHFSYTTYRETIGLQIYAVTPVSELYDGPMMDRVPERIKSFYRINNVSRFYYDRPLHKGPKDRENEFRVEVSPLENAIYVVENKNQELRSLISQYQQRHHHSNVNLLSMSLNGTIDAAVNGGIARYQEAFFDKDYISSHPEEMERINQLKELMQEQPSPSSSSLSSIRSSSSQMINSAPSSARGSPSLSDKNKNSRELLMLLPPHRERPSAIYYGNNENGQSPLQPIPGSPTSPVSVLGGSNSTLSGSASSGVSSLSESLHSHAETPNRNENVVLNRNDNPIETSQLHYWSPDDQLNSHYPHVHFSGVPEHIPYSSAPKPSQYGHYGAYSADAESMEPQRLCLLCPAGFSAIHEQYHHHHHIHGSLRRAGTPTVPPKPAQKEEEGTMPHPVPLPRRIFPPHRATWEQGIREEQEENTA
ncbi:Dedicator of cytokinesis protein 3 [Bagarius yarrelli]|uniref:Dedicator of cytokinesis protein 3 n=1 Tax=Bagarius yarrelli TaxID=175774 RepID=A0A556V9T3_BAGYA|nr:Dedicator of cytokinesis protein 3 [Bagarius yarrelli]